MGPYIRFASPITGVSARRLVGLDEEPYCFRSIDRLVRFVSGPQYRRRSHRVGQPFTGNTRVEQHPCTLTASTDGAGRRTGLVLSVSWAALVSPRAARGSLFVARAAPPASKATRGRPLVPQTTQAAPKCERACRSTAPKTRARQPGFRVPMKYLDVEGALGRALDNCSQAAPAFILCFGIAAFGSLETRAARPLALAIKQTFEHCNSGARISINCSSQTPVPHKSDKSRTAALRTATAQRLTSRSQWRDRASIVERGTSPPTREPWPSRSARTTSSSARY